MARVTDIFDFFAGLPEIVATLFSVVHSLLSYPAVVAGGAMPVIVEYRCGGTGAANGVCRKRWERGCLSFVIIVL